MVLANMFELLKDKDGKLIDIGFNAKRNDTWFNKNIPWQVLTWIANTDATVCTSAIAIIQ